MRSRRRSLASMAGESKSCATFLIDSASPDPPTSSTRVVQESSFIFCCFLGRQHLQKSMRAHPRKTTTSTCEWRRKVDVHYYPVLRTVEICMMGLCVRTSENYTCQFRHTQSTADRQRYRMDLEEKEEQRLVNLDNLAHSPALHVQQMQNDLAGPNVHVSRRN